MNMKRHDSTYTFEAAQKTTFKTLNSFFRFGFWISTISRCHHRWWRILRGWWSWTRRSMNNWKQFDDAKSNTNALSSDSWKYRNCWWAVSNLALFLSRILILSKNPSPNWDIIFFCPLTSPSLKSSFIKFIQ